METEFTPLLRDELERTVAELAEELGGVFSRETVRRYVEASYGQVGERPSGGPSFVPVIIRRFAREQLWAVAQADGRVAKEIDPVVVQAMAELGVDVAHEFPKPLTDAVVRAADVVVTMGCGDACPVYPGHRYQDWPIADPAGRPLAVVRQIRHDIYHRVWDLIETLAPNVSLLDLHLPRGVGR